MIGEVEGRVSGIHQRRGRHRLTRRKPPWRRTNRLCGPSQLQVVLLQLQEYFLQGPRLLGQPLRVVHQAPDTKQDQARKRSQSPPPPPPPISPTLPHAPLQAANPGSPTSLSKWAVANCPHKVATSFSKSARSRRRTDCRKAKGRWTRGACRKATLHHAIHKTPHCPNEATGQASPRCLRTKVSQLHTAGSVTIH